MNTKEILNQIFCQVFDDQLIVIYPEMTAGDLDGWDSFAHLNLIIAIEAKFDIQLTDDEVPRLKNVGDIISLIDNKKSNPNCF